MDIGEAADYIREQYGDWNWERTDDGKFMRVHVPGYHREQRVSTDALNMLGDLPDEKAMEVIDSLIEQSVNLPDETTPEAVDNPSDPTEQQDDGIDFSGWG
jgi:hypothetical protein